MTDSRPVDHGLPGWGWTLKKIRCYIQNQWDQSVCRNTIRDVLKQSLLSWKKSRKLLGKANPLKRVDYLAEFLRLYEQMLAGEVRLIYEDEAHFHRDLELGYTWSVHGERSWVVSDCPGLAERYC